MMTVRDNPSNTNGRVRRLPGWLVAVAGAMLAIGIFAMASSSGANDAHLLSEHAQVSDRVPPDLTVVVADQGKTFHLAECGFIHTKSTRTVSAHVAAENGYTPCARCLGKYLDTDLVSRSRQ
jgi:hypothetical protein